MKLLRSKQGFQRWMKQEYITDCGDTPLEYPCFAYKTVLSFGYEEERPWFLYASDLRSMLKKIEKLKT